MFNYRKIILSLMLFHSLQAIDQNIKSDAFKRSLPAKVAPNSARALNEHADYFFEQQPGVWYVWDIRNKSWKQMPDKLFNYTYGRMVEGPINLKPGTIQTYDLILNSLYSGEVKYVWKYDLTSNQTTKIGKIYLNDKIEIEWETRVSQGVRIISKSKFSTHLNYLEPLFTSFQVEISGFGPERIEIYANGYRDGNLVGYCFISHVINQNGYSEVGEAHEKRSSRHEKQSWEIGSNNMSDWRQAPFSESKARAIKVDYENHHALTKRYLMEGLRPGEFLTETEDSDRR